VENNFLSRDEAAEKASLKYKLQHGQLSGREKDQAEARLVQLDETDKARDQAIKDVCQSGSKASAGCRAMVAPAETALKKYGENVSYSLLYKDLYPQDAKNLENVLEGLDAGGVGRDQAITAIAKASGVSWDTAAKRYDTAMQLQTVTATLAGFYGVKNTGQTQSKTPSVANDAAKNSQLATGTVFDTIKATQPVYPGSVIPKSFEMSLQNGQKVWVHGNATEHMAEYAASKAVTYAPEAVRLASQEGLRSFQSAVNTATKSNIPYGERITIDGWQLEFKPPRTVGELPTIIHARYIGVN
jgi:filamentous hemagglutinin